MRSLQRGSGRAVIDGVGGLNPAQFHPAPTARPAAPLRVLVNGRRPRPKKGTDLILRALAGLEGVPPFEIVLFDTPGEGERDPRDLAPLPSNARRGRIHRDSGRPTIRKRSPALRLSGARLRMRFRPRGSVCPANAATDPS